MQQKINPIDGAEMVLVPAGEFKMGLSEAEIQAYCAKSGTDPSSMEIMRPQRTIYLDEYWIYKHPVTYGQYRAFCAAHPGVRFPRNEIILGVRNDLVMDDDYPAVLMSWAEACAYCKWAKVRLPTEAEWEKAARGTDGRLYPWGNEFDTSRANFDYRKPPGRIAAPCKNDDYADAISPYGAMHLVGNIREWCSDRFAPYGHDQPAWKSVIESWGFTQKEGLRDAKPGVIQNPTGPKVGQSRVIRGGGWGNPNYNWAGLTTFRRAEDPKETHRDVGFRPVSVSSR